MGKLALIAIAFAGCAVWPEAVSAQCVSFSKDIPCLAQTGPLNRVDFGAVKPQPKQSQSTKPQPSTPVPAPVKVEPAPAIDCAMVKKPDSQFHSNMPVIRPHPGVHYTLRVVPVAPCR